jgi:hypothetical protein
MYSTIVSSHPTIIRHPTPQPSGLGTHPDTAKAFALSQEAAKLAERAKKGIYEVPIKMDTSNSFGDSDDSLEIPNFIQSKETLMKNAKKINNEFTETEPQKFFKDNFSKDADMLLHNLENKADKAERIAACK